MGSSSNDLRIRIDADFPGERSFRSAQDSARALERELNRLEATQRQQAQTEIAAYREAEQRAAAHEAQVRRMAQAEMAAHREAARLAEQSAARQRAAMETLGPVLLAGGAVLGAGVVAAVKAFATFDAAMATVASSTHESAENMDQLRAAALAAGKDTSFSATEAAGAIDELAKAGVSTADILNGGLSGALSLAAAGGLEVAESAEIAATALTQFKLDGTDVGHVADLLAAGAGKAQGSVHDLGMALNQGGLVASQMGLSVEETTGTLAAFASAGLIGSDAGTSLKTALLMLANPSEKASRTMRELGIYAYDAGGRFVGMANLAGQLQTKLGGLDQAQRDSALATIFGSDAIRAANVLYSQGATGIQGWIDKTNDAGYAAVTAATKMDTLKGDLETLKGSLETALIQTGSAGDDFLRGAVQSVESLVDAYNDLPEPMQGAILALAGTTAAAATAGGAFLTLFPKIVETVQSVRDLAQANPEAAGRLAALGKAASIAGVALAALTVAGQFIPEAADKVMSMSEATSMLAGQKVGLEQLDASVKSLAKTDWSAGTDADGFGSFREGLQNLVDPSFRDRVADFGDVLAALVTTGSFGSTDGRQERAAFVGQLEAMGEGLAQLVDNGAGDLAAEQFQVMAEQAAAAGMSQEELLELLPGYRDALKDQDTQQKLAAQSGEQMASAITGVVPPTEDAAAAIDKLEDSLESMLSQFFSVDQASDAFQSSLHDIADAAKQNGRATEGNTEKAIANRAAMRDSAEAASDLLLAMARQGSGSDELAAKAAALKAEFINQAKAAGFTGAEVDKVVAAYDAMPSLVQTKVIAEGLANVASATAAFKKQLDQIDGRTITTTFQTSGNNVVGQRAGSVTARAGGGEVRGPGSETSDSIPVMLSDNEHVLSAAEVRGLGGHDAVRELRASALARPVGLAVGGTPDAPGLGGAGALVSRSLVLSALTATAGPVDGSRREQALRREAAAAQVAEAAERNLNRARERGAAMLDELDDRQEAALQALKDRHTAAEDAGQDEVERLRKKKNNDAAVAAATDRLTALKRANDAAEKALKRAQDDETDAAKAANKKAEADATEALTRAKDKERDATEELKDSEAELADARQRAVQLAERAADALARNANLGSAYSSAVSRLTAARGAGATQRELSEAEGAADAAGSTVRGETRAAALKRRSDALTTLTAAGAAWAKTQREMGVDAASVEAGLDAVRAKVTSLGAAYGLTSDQLAAMTENLAAQAEVVPSGQDLLAGLQGDLERMKQTAEAISALENAGLDRGLVDQLFEKGTDQGLAMAQALLSGGSGLIAQFNATQADIDRVATGFGSSLAAGRYAPGGHLEAQPVSLLEGASVALVADTHVALAANTAVGLIAGTSVAIDAATLAALESRITTALASRPLVVTLDGGVLYASHQAHAADAALGLAL